MENENTKNIGNSNPFLKMIHPKEHEFLDEIIAIFLKSEYCIIEDSKWVYPNVFALALHT